MEVRNHLNASLGLDLPPTLIFDYPTIAALTAFVLSCSLSAGTKATAKDGLPQLQDVESLGKSRGTGGQQDVLMKVQAAFSEILGTEIAPDQPFAAAGLDSLAAVEVRNNLNR